MKERPLSTRIPETSSPLSERTLVRHGLGASPALKTSPVDQRQAYTVGYSTPKSYTKEVSPEFFQRVCDADDLWTRTQGAIALLMLWVVWLAGSFCAFWWPYLVFKGYHKAAIATALIMAYPYVVKVKQSPAFIRFILSGAGWFKGGTCLYLEESMKNVETSQVRVRMRREDICDSSSYLGSHFEE